MISRFLSPLCVLVTTAILIGKISAVKAEDKLGNRSPYSTVIWLQIDEFDQFISSCGNSSFANALVSMPVFPIIDEYLASLPDDTQARYGISKDEGIASQLQEMFSSGSLEVSIFPGEKDSIEYIALLPINDEYPPFRAFKKICESSDERKQHGIELIDDQLSVYRVGTYWFSMNDSKLIMSSGEHHINSLLAIEEEGINRGWKKRLSKNMKFQRVGKNASFEKPFNGIRFYIDIGHFAKKQFSSNTRSQKLMKLILETGALDLLCGGGKFVFPKDVGPKIYSGVEWYIDFHVLIAEPRRGLSKALSFRPVDDSRLELIPHDVDFCFLVNSDLSAMRSGINDLLEVGEKVGWSRNRTMVGISQIAPMITVPIMLGDAFDQFDGNAIYFGKSINHKSFNQFDFTLYMGVKDKLEYEALKAILSITDKQPGARLTNKKTDGDTEYWTITDNSYQKQIERQKKIRFAKKGISGAILPLRPALLASEGGIFFFSNVNSLEKYFEAEVSPELLKEKDEFKHLIRCLEFNSGSGEFDAIVFLSPGQLYRTFYYQLLANMGISKQIDDFRKQKNIDGSETQAELDMRTKIESIVATKFDEWPGYEEFSTCFGFSGGGLSETKAGVQLTFFQFKAKNRN